MTAQAEFDLMGWSAPGAAALPVVNCCAALEEIIVVLDPLRVGPVAVWSTGGVVEIAGRVTLRSNHFGERNAVRWLCPANGGKGLFGKGYVEVTRAHVCRVAHLPEVK